LAGFPPSRIPPSKKVVLDCSYGPSGEISPTLLSGLDIQIIALNTFVPNVINKTIPSYESIKEISGIVKASGADLGVAMDVDGSRAIYFDETGEIADFNQLIAMFLLYEKSIKNNRQSSIVVVDSCSNIIYDLGKELDQEVHTIYNDPGQISAKIKEHRAIFGASDTGKFYFAEYGPFSDANLTTLKILEIMGETGMRFSTLLRETPKTVKDFKDIPLHPEIIGNLHSIFNPMEKRQDFSIIDVLYGIKVVFEPGNWILVKPSLHRDAVELYAEAESRQNAVDMINEVEGVLLLEEEKYLSKIDKHEKT